jgi:hypothetical protein
LVPTSGLSPPACLTHLAACAARVTPRLIHSISEHYFPEKRPNPIPPQDNLHNNTPVPAPTSLGSNSSTGAAPLLFSLAEFCNDTIVGLVYITPAIGYVSHQVAPLFGVPITLVCSQLMPLSDLPHDTQNIIVVHGIAGAGGDADDGVFARGRAAALDSISGGELARGGWGRRWRQLL